MASMAARKSFHQSKTAFVDHASTLRQAALFILPGKQNNEPMLEENPNEFGIPLAHDPPAVGRALCIDASVLLPVFVKPFHVSAFA